MTILVPSSGFLLRVGSHTLARRVGRVSPSHANMMSSFLQQSSSSVDGVKNYSTMTIADTPLGTKTGSELLDGLDVYCIQSTGDNHPLSVYGIESSDPKETDIVLLMLHGRTWSSVPVFHLLGGPNNAGKGLESHSLMEELLSRKIQVYSMDFRGFGGTPKDVTKGVEPNRCVEDVESVLAWIQERHGPSTSLSLLGWSQGALVAQLAAQRRKPAFSKLILYGSIYDPLVRYPREPLYVQAKDKSPDIENTFNAAVEDFTIEGTIPPEPARKFAEAALLSDPVKAQWKQLHQFNNLDPARVHVPTLVVAGDQDPYAPLRVQQELFVNLARGSDKTWSILANADHAVHLLEGRSRFASVVSSFLWNSKTHEDRS